MDMTQAHLQAPLRGTLRLDEPMAEHVSWRAGGVAERCYVPADLADLELFLKTSDGAVYFVGLGSNLLVRDGGLRGTVILLHGALNHIKLTPQGLIYAEAGVSSPKVASFAARHDLEGAEFLSGIPGTVGGALAMNAGCYGRETWQCVRKVLTIDGEGTLLERLPSDYEIGYRHVELRASSEQLAVSSKPAHRSLLTAHPQEWFVAAWFGFTPGDGKAAKKQAREWLAKRMATQPLTQPNAGSVFRNPPGDYAARLIEASGLKGLAVGGAQVSEKHANFIVNLGNASAADIESLIETVQAKVKQAHGVELVREVRIIGDKA
ncbi:UDP-N-acetylenolpyruvoylglucosamine reductase [Sulfurimicrobium lacus]|uniref:UDP-N-acetylenolpyruvoylglucosamine reductase n=1 Tax=Sulfurimicrobium lacus TaxID=2715678 RepID=A0A6F8V6Z9_9PROT|nr:UDP-N-acetylmuramate dehydrogenase [Sulfurimicrobium lacus]BCB25468.1 UDP-N-acetylenolpyruvoylglucosamine reductase [Sulfurimicrobium lacus]